VIRSLNLSLGFFAAVIALGNEAVPQAAVDAALSQEKPTVQSEVKRGSDASGDCVKGVLALDAMADCIFKTSNDNRKKMGTGTEAFDLGLSFGGWFHATLSAEALAATSDFAQQAEHIASTKKIFWGTYVDLRKKVNLTDDQIIEVTGLRSEDVRIKVRAAAAEYGD
jgi:hypothetical protein